MATKPTYEELEHRVRKLENEQSLHGRARERLRESEERLRTVLNTIQVGVLVVDTHAEAIVGVNEGAARMLGEPMEAILGKPYVKYVCPKAPKVALEQEADPAKGESVLVGADGTKIPVLRSVVSILLGGRVHRLESFLDITERKKAELEREVLIAELMDALTEIRTLSGLLPICSSCKRIRDDKGYWQQIEAYVREHSHANFSHSVCPECAKKLYPEFMSDH